MYWAFPFSKDSLACLTCKKANLIHYDFFDDNAPYRKTDP